MKNQPAQIDKDQAFKTKQLKRWVGSYAGNKTGIVAAYSKKEAAELVETSLKEFRGYWSEVNVYNHIAPEKGFWLTLEATEKGFWFTLESNMGCSDFERVK